MHKSDVEQHISEYATGNHRKRYISIIRKLTNFDRDTAESVFQQCLLEAWQRRAEVRGESFRNYFYVILRRACIAERNKHRAMLGHSSIDEWNGESGTGLEHIDPDPTDKIMVDQALATLSRQHREVVMDWATSSHGSMPDPHRTLRARRALRRFTSCPAT